MLPESSDRPPEASLSPPPNLESASSFTPPAQGAGLFDDAVEARQRTGAAWIIASGLVLLVGVGGWFGYRVWKGNQVDLPTVTTETVGRQTLEDPVTASGVVSLGNQQTLKSPGEFTVEAVLVQARQRVSQGTVLLRLRARGLEQQLAEARLQADLDQLKYERAQEVLQDKQRDVQRAEAELEESQTLLDRGFISEDAYNQDRDDLETAQSALREAQLALREAEVAIQKNQVTLANIQAQLADAAIVAPFDAVVLNINVQDGQGLANDTTLLTLGDPNQEVILFDLMPLDANKVSVNMPVRISIIGPNPDPLPGRVISIAPQAVSSNNAGDSGDASQAKVQAVAQLDQPSGTLIPGSQVSVEVILVQRPNVVAVPLSALQQDEDTPYVWVVGEDNTVEKRSVVTGLTTLDAVEITSGLRENETIIPNPTQPLTDGMAVIPGSADMDMPPQPE
ncbi:MAG: efflux RND transporter periplasmic adaptor subunit [Spirulina sp.]